MALVSSSGSVLGTPRPRVASWDSSSGMGSPQSLSIQLIPSASPSQVLPLHGTRGRRSLGSWDDPSWAQFQDAGGHYLTSRSSAPQEKGRVSRMACDAQSQPTTGPNTSVACGPKGFSNGNARPTVAW